MQERAVAAQTALPGGWERKPNLPIDCELQGPPSQGHDLVGRRHKQVLQPNIDHMQVTCRKVLTLGTTQGTPSCVHDVCNQDLHEHAS